MEVKLNGCIINRCSKGRWSLRRGGLYVEVVSV